MAGLEVAVARAVVLALLIVLSALVPVIPAGAAACTGAVVGRLVLAYGDRGPAAGEWIHIKRMPGDSDGQAELVQATADGSFRLDGMPVGWHNATARDALFAFNVPGCGQTVDVEKVEYPLVHLSVPPVPIGPTHPAATALGRFLAAMLARNGPATLAWVTDDLRAQAPYGFTGQSNPCLYRYEVLALNEYTTPTPGQPPLGTVEARVRIYTHFWPGDLAGGPPRSFTQGLTLIDTPRGWRVSDLTQIEETREEPNEPHGPTISACDVGRRPAVWLVAGSLPATGGPSPILVSAVGLMLLGMGFAVRWRFQKSEPASGSNHRRRITGTGSNAIKRSWL